MSFRVSESEQSLMENVDRYLRRSLETKLYSLPSDVLLMIIQKLGVCELASLSQTCKLLHALVNDQGWAEYLLCNQRPSFSLSRARSIWTARNQVRYDTLTDRAWTAIEFMARPLDKPWAGNMHPVLGISPSRLIVAAGSTLYFYSFTQRSVVAETPSIEFEGSCTMGERGDITSISFIPDGGSDRTLSIGFQTGALECYTISTAWRDGRNSTMGVHSYKLLQTPRKEEAIESLSTCGNALLSLSTGGIATLTNMSNSSYSATSIHLQKRSWSSYLSSGSSFAAFGTASTETVAVHPITECGLSDTPSAILCSHVGERFSAAYGITAPPFTSTWGASDQILVSGWYDGVVLVHDLRVSRRVLASESPGGPSRLLPVLNHADPWSYEPVYDVSCGGGASSIIAAGSARYSVVSFWDVRFPSKGWSVYAPGNDRSPVYSVKLESSRLFGATQSRPFMLDFGPDRARNTYPSLPDTRAALKYLKHVDGVGYATATYRHSRRTAV